MTTQTTSFDRAATVLEGVPHYTTDQQRLAVELYRQLTLGEPVPAERLGASLGIQTPAVVAQLEDERFKGLVYYDDAKQVIGFGGLAVRPMHHRFEVEGRTLYTWCAWDSLFIPERIGKPARVESRCPQTDTVVRLTVTPERVESVDPADAVVSFLGLDPELLSTDPNKVMAGFCHYIFFLASPAAAARWTSEHEGTFVLTVTEAFELARRLNAKQLGDVLAR